MTDVEWFSASFYWRERDQGYADDDEYRNTHQFSSPVGYGSRAAGKHRV
jgi:hypothetical protein